MQIAPFRLERFFAQHEFDARYLLCSSDCESLSVADLLALEPGAAEGLSRLWLGYTESTGHPLLREAIAGLYAGITPEQILVHTGAEEAIFLFQQAMFQKGDHIIVQWPCYQSLFEVANSIGCEISLWAGQPDGGGWNFDLERLKSMLRADTRAVLVNGPHNPTGYLMPQSDWRELVTLSQKNGFFLFSDEVYSGLELNPADHLQPACEQGERCVSLNVMSKTFGLAGLRIGWVATQNQAVYARMAALKDYTTICNSAPSEYLSMVALRQRDKIVARNRALMARNLDLLERFFTRYADRFIWYPPRAGSIAFPALRSGQPAGPFCRSLVEETGVLLLPGDQYDPAYAGHFRIGFGRANLPEALEHLDAYLERSSP